VSVAERAVVEHSTSSATSRERYSSWKGASRALLGWVVLVAALAVWQYMGTTAGLFYLPPLTDVGGALWELLTGPGLTIHVLPSLGRAVVGLLICVVAGIGAGILIGFFRASDPWLRPVLEFFRAVPPPVVLPLGLALLGAGNTMRLAVIVFGSIWPILLNAIDGARRVEPLLLDSARVAGLSTWGLLRRVVLPSSLVQIFAGIRTAVALALIMMVISEMIASSAGLGYLILQAQRTFQISNMWAGVVLLGALGWSLNAAFLRVEGRVLSWHLARNQRSAS
jgi:ABC-type nitrate/sulfonate/bicarbonate transport system permease component